MASAAEAETGAIFLNGQQAIPIRTALLEMGHPQPPILIKTDSTTSYGILTGNMQRKRSKAFDMRFHFMRCRIKQNQYCLYWRIVVEIVVACGAAECFRLDEICGVAVDVEAHVASVEPDDGVRLRGCVVHEHFCLLDGFGGG